MMGFWNGGDSATPHRIRFWSMIFLNHAESTGAFSS